MDKLRIFKIAGGVALGVAAVAAAPFTGGGSIIAGAAALGLGTAAAAGAAVAVGAAGGVLATLFSEDDKPLVKKGIVILGIQNSGKTTIYDFLKGEKKAGVNSKIDEYEEFKYFFNEKDSIVIRKGIDMGGDPGIFGRYFGRMINDINIDFCFFVFNAFAYVNKEEYRRDVNSRLHSIYEKGILKKNTAIIGSFMDHFKKEEMPNVYDKINRLTINKSYSRLLSREYFHLIDLTDDIKLKNLINTTLKK